jgi:hypothetical protein
MDNFPGRTPGRFASWGALQIVRTLVCSSFLICIVGCRAQSPESQVLDVYKQLERAAQSGDADNTLVGLWSREKVSQAEGLRSLMHLRPQPDAHYTSSRVFVQGDDAVLLGQYAQDGFVSIRFVKEDGRWKIKDFTGSDKPYPAESVYAMLPPPPGAFGRAGEPWQNVAPALDKATAAKQGWQLRAAYDESLLYIQIESSKPMPAPGTRAEKPPMGWPVMKVDVSGVGEFVLHPEADIADHATFDQSGHANSHQPYVAYGLMLERADKMIFQAWADSDPHPLIQVGGNAFELRVPLRTMGIADPTQTRIVIGDAQWPKSAIFTDEAQQYR